MRLSPLPRLPTVTHSYHLYLPLARSSPTSCLLPCHPSSLHPQPTSSGPPQLLLTPNTHPTTTLSAPTCSKTGAEHIPKKRLQMPALLGCFFTHPGLPPGVSSHKPRCEVAHSRNVWHMCTPLSTTSSHRPGGQVPGGRGAAYQQEFGFGKGSS